MRRLSFLVLAAVIAISGLHAYAAENKLINIRNDIFNEAKKIRAVLTETKDVIFMNSLYDSCLMTVTQIDAYFSMLGIFNTIKEKDLDEAAVDNIIRWLDVAKKTNELNIKSIDKLPQAIEQETEAQVKKIADYFKGLGALLDGELGRFAAIKRSIR